MNRMPHSVQIGAGSAGNSQTGTLPGVAAGGHGRPAAARRPLRGRVSRPLGPLHGSFVDFHLGRRYLGTKSADL